MNGNGATKNQFSSKTKYIVFGVCGGVGIQDFSPALSKPKGID